MHLFVIVLEFLIYIEFLTEASLGKFIQDDDDNLLAQNAFFFPVGLTPLVLTHTVTLAHPGNRLQSTSCLHGSYLH